MLNIPAATKAFEEMRKWSSIEDGNIPPSCDSYMQSQLKLAALEYSAAVMEYVFNRLLDEGNRLLDEGMTYNLAMPVIKDLLTVARERPESLP